MVLAAGIAGVVVLAGAGTAAWMFLGRIRPPSQADIDAIGANWLNAHRAALLDSACLSNFPYANDPVYVGNYDSGTRNWLDTLVRAGVYAGPTPNGPFQVRYTHGPQAATYVQAGRLCLAQGPKLLQTSVRPVSPQDVQAQGLGELAQHKGALEHLRLLHLSLGWQQVAPFATWPQIQQADPQFNPAPQGDLLLIDTSAGWKDVRDPANAATVDPALSKLAGQAVVPAQGAAQQPSNGQPVAAQGSGMFSWLRNLFSFGHPERKLPSEFFDDIQSANYDAAYALLGPQMQIVGRDKMRMGLSLQHEALAQAGGVAGVDVTGETDAGSDTKVIQFVLKLHDGEQRQGAMSVSKIHGKWYIVDLPQ